MSVDLLIPDDVHAQLQTALALIAHHEKELARRDAQIAEMASIGAVIAKEDRQRMAKDIGVAQGRTGVGTFSGMPNIGVPNPAPTGLLPANNANILARIGPIVASFYPRADILFADTFQ